MQYVRDNQNEFEYKLVNHKENEELHCHNRIEIIRVNTGKIRLRVDMGSLVYDVFAGDYAVIKSPDVHRIFTSRVTCEIEHVLFPVSYQNMFEGDYIKSSFVIPKEVFDASPDIKAFVESSMSILSSADSGSSLTRSLCASLCSLMLSLYDKRRRVVSTSSDSTEIIPLRGGASIETMEKFDTVIAYIDENYTDSKINLPSLSEFSGLGKTFLSALFPKLTGKNFTSYIHHLRINRSIELLASTEKNISEIAYLCGFETIRSFNNVFKKIVGTTPSGFVAALYGEDDKGIDTEIFGIGNNIFKYNWFSNVEFSKDFKNEKISVTCTNTSLKLWCHLRLRMLFFAGKEYNITFKLRFLYNSVGVSAANEIPFCDFYFNDPASKTEHHNSKLVSKSLVEDGWYKYEFLYSVPDYYKPSSDDNFSVYSSPLEDLGVSYELKDICVKIV